MSEQNQQPESLQEVKDIRRLMERSSRFISLSGLSGVAAGIFALAGAAIARYVIFKNYYTEYNERGFFASNDFQFIEVAIDRFGGRCFCSRLFFCFLFYLEKIEPAGFFIMESHITSFVLEYGNPAWWQEVCLFLDVAI